MELQYFLLAGSASLLALSANRSRQLSGTVSPYLACADVETQSVKKLLAGLCVVALSVCLDVAPSSASDFESERLLEVLRSANLREAPSKDSSILEVIPGGMVVAVVSEHHNDPDWQQVASPGDQQRVGFVHKSLLADTSFSYEMTVIENDIHKIKSFGPRRGIGYIYPQRPARIYAKDGTYLAQLPRLEDRGSAGTLHPLIPGFYVQGHVTPGGFNSEFPYYKITHWSGGMNCCYSYRYLTKEPFLEHSFQIDHRMASDWALTEQADWIAEVYDPTYKYWAISEEIFLYNAIAPRPTVTLQLVDGQPEVSRHYMHQDPLSDSEFDSVVSALVPLSDDLSERELDLAIARLVSEMLNLIYAGREEDAFRLLEALWPSDLQIDYVEGVDRDLFKTKLAAKVQTSPYYRSWMLGVETELVSAPQAPVRP